MENISKRLVTIGHWEGVSYLVLLLIAMPLKYMMDMPMAVRIVGGLHGILFIAFCFILYKAWRRIPLSFGLATKLFILSFIPCGTFFIQKMLPKTSE